MSQSLLHLRIPGRRLGLGLFIGVLCAGLAYVNFTWRDRLAGDFTVTWRAARLLLANQNPYEQINPGGSYPWHDHFLYPLPAALIALPVAISPPILAGAIFFGASCGLLAFALLRQCPWRLPLFLSSPFLVAAAVGQWSPLLVAAAISPSLQALLLTKPTLGLSIFAYRFSWKIALEIIIILLCSLLILPSWLSDWISEIQHAPRLTSYHIPALVFPPLGLILVAALFFWRQPEGRLLFILSIVPQTIWFYDQLLLWLIPRNGKESWLLTGLSWLAYGLWRLGRLFLPPEHPLYLPDVYILTLCFIPALGLLLRARVAGAASTTLDR